MDNRLKLFWEELLLHSQSNNKLEFVFQLEWWGVLWMPWFIYMEDKSLNFSSNDISEDDLNKLIRLDKIELVEEIHFKNEIELYKKRYRIKSQD